MTAWTVAYGGLVQAAFVASLVFAVAIAIAAALVYPRLRPKLRPLAPARRASLLFALAGLPLAGAVAGLLVSFMPSLLSWIGLTADHCHLHPDHPHLCWLHPPRLARSALALGMLLTLAGLFVLATGSWIVRCLHTRRVVGQLLRLSAHDPLRGVRIVATEAPIAFAAGLSAPHVFLSTRVLAELSPRQINVVIASSCSSPRTACGARAGR